MDFKNIDEGHPDGEQPLHFFYNREERLKKAPKLVQDYYAGKVFNNTVGIKGLFKSLVSTRTNKFLLASLIVFCAAIFIFNFLTTFQNKTACGIPVEMKAFSFDEQIHVSLKFEEKKASGENKEVENNPVSTLTVVFTGYDNQKNPVYLSKEYTDSYFGRELTFTDKFQDYDIVRVEAKVSSGEKRDIISAKVD